MRTLYEASNSAEAHMLLELLKQQGISSHIQGEYLQGAVGGLPAIGLVRLVVEDGDFARARSVVEQWEANEVASEPVEKKGSPMHRGFAGFLLGLAVGIGGMYGIYKAPGTVDGIDHNRDGHLDEKWTYASNGRPLKLEIDRNLDRKVDYISRYDMRGQIESADSDEDFNGTFETETVFRKGNARYAETDTDGDSYPDLRANFTDGVLDSVEYIKPTTGLPLRIERFRLGKLLSADIDVDDDGALDTRLTYGPLGEVADRQSIPSKTGG